MSSEVASSSNSLWLQLVLTYLSVRDLFHFRAVSRQTFALVTEHFARMSHLDLSRLGALRFNWCHFQLLIKDNSCLRRLSVANAWWIEEEAFSAMLRRQCRLVSLDLTGSYTITNNTLLNLGLSCPALETLILKHCNWLSCEVFALLASQCEQLSEIDLTSCWNLDDHCIGALFRKLGSRLQRVTLASLYSLTDCTMEAIERHATSLIFLDISSCWRITDRGIEYCSGAVARQTTLIDFSRCRGLSRNASLEQIVLDGCSQISLVGQRCLVDSGIEIVRWPTL